MKKYFILVMVFLFSCLINVSAQIRSNRDLIGKWKGDDLQLEFFNDQKVIMILPGGKLPVATYSADFMRTPIEVQLILTDNGQKKVYKGELEFLDNETIRLKYFGDEERKDAFAKGRTITLKKGR